jgi:hypothetical protein
LKSINLIYTGFALILISGIRLLLDSGASDGRVKEFKKLIVPLDRPTLQTEKI